MQQKKILDFNEVVKLVNEPLEVNDFWYLLDKKWYEMCKDYLETEDKTKYPGPIDNSALFEPVASSSSKSSNGVSPPTIPWDSVLKSFDISHQETLEAKGPQFKTPIPDLNNSRQLRKDLNEAEGHFILIPEKCWNLLKNTFGIKCESHAIMRRVIEPSPGSKIVEIQPIVLMLCLYGGKEPSFKKTFSRMTTLDELRREAQQTFSIGSDQEVKLWMNNTVCTFKPESLSPSKSESNIKTSGSTSLTKQSTSGHLTSNTSSNFSSPTVITRQAALSMNKLSYPLAPDSPTPLALSNSSSESPLSNAPQQQQQAQTNAKMTLAEACVSDGTVATLEVMNADGTWPSSRSRYGAVSTRSSKAQPGLCGLSNMGNTCFMNSALQCLSNTPHLTNYILTDKFVQDINTNNPLGMHGEIARTYADLIKVLWSGNHSSFLPREFKCAVSRFAPQFNGFAQQDCQELMAFLLDGLHEDLNRIKKKPYIEIKNDVESRPDEVVAQDSWSSYKMRNDSIVVDTFHAMLKSTLVCPGCELVSVTFDPFCYLSLPLPAKREKQINVIFIPAPGPINDKELAEISSFLEPEEIEAIKQYGGSISSFSLATEEYGLYSNSKSKPRGCKMQVPRSGPVSEICDIVARTMNEDNEAAGRPMIKSCNLVVAEIINDLERVSKIYEPNEHYNQINEDIIVIEKGSKYLIPLYIRERKATTSPTAVVVGRPMFLHVPDMKCETLYKSCMASLSNLTSDFHMETQVQGSIDWFNICLQGQRKLKSSSESEVGTDLMDCDSNESVAEHGDTGGGSSNGITSSDETKPKKVLETEGMEITQSNGSSERKVMETPFDLCVVNTFGGNTIETLEPNGDEFDYNSKLYLGATFMSRSLTMEQFEHLRRMKYADAVETFVPKAQPKPTIQLRDCVTQFTNVERLGADDPWYCPKCKKHQQATKKFDIWSLPKVLIIHLKRFSFSRSWRDKIDTLVEFPVDRLDMSQYVLNPSQKKEKKIYNLIGVANHYGGLGGGHYTAYAKNFLQNQWYTFDDALVSPTNANNVVTRSAYVLFYQLQEADE